MRTTTTAVGLQTRHYNNSSSRRGRRTVMVMVMVRGRVGHMLRSPNPPPPAAR
jgi:hypothetical protein